MKDLLTERSNQSHLVGIPKSEAVNTAVGKTEEHFHQNTIESHYSICHTVQTGITPGTKSLKLNSRTTMNWHEAGNTSLGQNIVGKTDQRIIGSPTSDFKCEPQKHITEKNKKYSLSPTSSTTSSSNDHHLSVLTCTLEKPLNMQMTQSKLNCNLEFDLSIKEKTCNKNSNSSHSMQNFPSSISSKLNPVQQKPTAYVRPMDGQDQTPNESPKLKLSTEFNMLFPLYRGLSNKVDSDRLLSDKTETPVDLSEGEDNQHSSMGFNSQKNGDLKVRSPAQCAAQISMLEDDLKLSSDEEDCHQPATQGQAIGVQSGSGDIQKCSNRASGASIKGSSSSSSESDTSSESDSESESSSSESESSKPSVCTSPEPQEATSNKWQLDKWLNKVNPNKNSILNKAQITSGGVNEVGQTCDKVSEVCQSTHNDKDDRSPVREDRTALGNTTTVVVAAPVENTSHRRTACRKLTKRAERTSSGDHFNCHKLDDTSLSPGIPGNEIPDQTKNRFTCNSRGLHRKEPRTALFGCKSRWTQITRSAPKSKEFIEFLEQSSEQSTETELKIPPLSKNISAFQSENNHRLKECGSNNIGHNKSYSTHSCVNTRNTSDIAPELEEQFYTLVPFGRNDSVCSVKGSDEIKSLWVRIDLTLLSRIPQDNLSMNTSTENTPTSPQNKCLPLATDNALLKMRRKRKFEREGSQMTKKNHVEMEDRLRFPVDNYDTSNSDSTNTNSFEMHLTKSEKCLSPLPFFPDEPKLKCTSNGFSSASKRDGHTVPSYVSCNQHHRQENQSHARQRSLPIPSGSTTTVHNRGDQQSDSCSPVLNGHRDARRTKQLVDSTTPCNADYFMQEAKQMKHKADAMVNKFDKMLNYTEAALLFIECGNAMETGPMESKSPYTMYSETVELIRYALRLKSHSGHNASAQDKKITALCYRCLALLYWRMFRLKRDHAVKYSKALIDYFKKSSKAHRVPSPWNANGKTTGTSSPTSPSLSHVSSVSSQGSISSSSSACSTSNSIISIPQRIHQMAANHVSITNSILHSYDYWEIADNLAKDNTEFFSELDALMGPVTFHSSMEHLVQYTRQGLSWIRRPSSDHVL
ncbi:AF4/FMR2 family member 3 [Mixophyes fleayi]|uniref:AF4/FMR2 family member 3 n=1 Tax=Mixophyes fleayi TaxID=3061075 RepID=UPI003F4DFD8B